MEDICFSYLWPEEYRNIDSQIMEQQSLRENFTKRVTKELEGLLKMQGVNAQIVSRLKHHYSIYQKLKRKNKNFVHDLYDLIALRVILDDAIVPEGRYDDSHCYTTLGIIHKQYSPLTNRFKDYIALPKENGYKSLHTAIMGIGGKKHKQPTEIQIRTRRMDEEAEVGVAAHWEYKEGGFDFVIGDKKREWIRSLSSLRSFIEDTENGVSDDLKIDLFKDNIFVLTPRGDVRDLPKGATPIDFAYSIHTDIGHRFRGAKVNGKIVPLDYRLEDGDVVEILTGNKEAPNLYWLSSVATQSARSKIKAWFKGHDRDNLISLGKDLVNKYLRRYNLPVLDANLKVLADIYQGKLNLKEREDLLAKVGQGVLAPKDVVRKVLDKVRPLQKVSSRVKAEGDLKSRNSIGNEILIRGEKGYETKIANCCNPVPGDQVKGYVTSKAVSIHKVNCSFIKKLSVKQKEKVIDVSWDGILDEDKKVIDMKVDFDPAYDLLPDILKVFRECNVDLKVLQTMHNRSISNLLLSVAADTFDYIHEAFDRIENLTGVKRIVQKERGE